MMYNDYSVDNISIINKMQEKIKEEKDKINDCNLNIHLYTNYLVEKIRGLNIEIPLNVLRTVWQEFHREKDEIKDKDKYKVCYDIIKDTIIRDIIGDTKCTYKKIKLINDITACGFESYAYNISFIANNIEFMFIIPCVQNIFDKNMMYANYGKYVLAYKETPCCSAYITTSYNLEDLAKAFKNFIEERDKNNASLA